VIYILFFLYLVLAHYLLTFSLYVLIISFRFLVFVLGSLDIILLARWIFLVLAVCTEPLKSK